MNHLGIRPATEEQNGWRRDLLIGKGGGVLNAEIRRKLMPTFVKLEIKKPQLLIWFLMSQGGKMVTEEERKRRILELTFALNAEFGKHNPIQ